MSLRVCASRPNRSHKTTAAGAFHNVCVVLASSCQDTSRKVTPQGEQLRTGESDVYQQPIAGLTPLALCCSMEGTQNECGLSPLDVVLCSLLCHALSQVHRQGDLGDEVDGHQGRRRQALGRRRCLPQARRALWSPRKTRLMRQSCGSTSCCEFSHVVMFRRSLRTATTRRRL